VIEPRERLVLSPTTFADSLLVGVMGFGGVFGSTSYKTEGTNNLATKVDF
jgi:hypothetical protein